MPHLVRWHDELADFGLVVVAPHSQGGTDDEVRTAAARWGLRCSVTKGASVPGGDGGGLPHVYVFGPDGTCVHDGHPKDAEPKIRAAVGAAIVAAAGVMEPAKSVAPVVDILRKGQKPSSQLGKLSTLKGSTEKGVAAQAKALYDAILAPAKKRLDEATEEKDTEPVASYETAARLALTMKGTPIGTQANELAVKLKGTRAVGDELKARPVLEQVKKLDAALRARAKDGDTADAAFLKANAAGVKQLRSQVKRMEKDWPNAPATKEAGGIAERYGGG
jgi:hypothetical protein